MQPNTAIVILNFNGLQHLQKHLPGVIRHSEKARVVVIDNASTDASVEWLRSNHPGIELIVNDKNYGFAGGYNMGLKKVNADVFVLLNSDIEVTGNWLDAPLACLQGNENIAACQPRIRALLNPSHFEHAGASGGYVDRFGFPFCRGRIFDHAEEDHGQYDDTREVFWATGACLFIRSDAFFRAGGFDADFFAHMEEIDLCWRLKRLGYKIFVVPSSIVYHLGGGTLQYQSTFKTRLNFRNNLFMMQKNLHNHIFITLFWRLFLDGVAGWKFLFSGNGKHTWAILLAHIDFYKFLFRNRKKRKTFNREHRPNPHYPLTGWYKRSIVFDYFWRKKKKFSDLDI